MIIMPPCLTDRFYFMIQSKADANLMNKSPDDEDHLHVKYATWNYSSSQTKHVTIWDAICPIPC